MAKGNLVVQLSDMTGALVKGRVEIDLRRVDGSNGAGGENMKVSVNGPVGTLTVTGIPCQPGPGTMYEVRASAEHYRTYAFFQLIRENQDNTASDDVEFWVKPGDVANIQAPAFADLPASVRAMCDQARMIVDKPEDREVVGLSGSTLYQQMGPLRKACLLNIVKKVRRRPGAAAWPGTGRPCCRQTRGRFPRPRNTLYPRRASVSRITNTTESATISSVREIGLTSRTAVSLPRWPAVITAASGDRYRHSSFKSPTASFAALMNIAHVRLYDQCVRRAIRYSLSNTSCRVAVSPVDAIEERLRDIGLATSDRFKAFLQCPFQLRICCSTGETRPV